MKVLTLNCGSSSVKYSAWEMPQTTPLCQGIVERVGLGSSIVRHRSAGRAELRGDHDCPTHGDAIRLIFDTITRPGVGIVASLNEFGSVAHRVVHGGRRYTTSVMIDDAVVEAIEEHAMLAPLHNPNNLAGIRTSMKLMPNVAHTASWDTAFSAAFLPAHASVYALPPELSLDLGIRRYGYQGLSHLYVSRRASVLLGKGRRQTNLVSLHIGNGSTATAVKDGLPYDQSLGFSTCGEGLVMGTRCGDLDPIVPLFLMRHAGLSLDEVEDLLYRRSGVFGLSGHVDRRDLIRAAERGDERSRLALDVECYRLRKYIGAYAAAVGGIDAVVFTAGVGENSPIHRSKACEGLESFGIELDQGRNAAAVGRAAESEISSADSRVRVFVIPTDEELVMAEDAYAIHAGTFASVEEFEYSFESPDFVPSYLRFR